MSDATAFSRHDHTVCIAETVSRAEAICARDRLRLTPARRRVLEILLSEHRAMGAYEILDILRLEGLGAQPPVAYRALDFLVAHGFAHKIERLNAFIACSHPGEVHAPAFLICRECGRVAETSATGQGGRLGAAALEAGFAIERTVMEAEGLCLACANEAS